MSLSDLGNLINLKGLITVSIGSLLAVKAMHFTWHVSKNNVSVSGNGNNVIVINQEMDGVRRSFRLLWNLLLAIVFLTYPLAGEGYTSVLAAMAFFGVPLAVAWFIVITQGFGAQRIWDFFYVLGVAFACWLVFCATPSLPLAAKLAGQMPVVLGDIRLYGLNQILGSSARDQYIFAFYSALTTLLGFTLLFLSTGYLLFGFTRQRSFDGAIRHTLTYGMAGVAGYFLVCGALINSSPGRLMDLAYAVVSPLLN